MAYIGKAPVNGFHSKQTLSTDGSTVTFTLDFTVADETSIIVSVGGVLQEPKVAYNLAGGGTQITFTAAPASIDTAYIQYLGQAIVQNLLDASGAEVILDADNDTSFTADTDDEIDIKVGGTDRSTIKATGFHNVDSVKFVAGTGDDLQLYHDGTNSFLTNTTGALKIATETSGIAVTIGHTTSEVTVADNMTVTGDLTVTGTANFGDTNITNVGSITLDSILNDGTDITLDSSNDIVIDAAGGNIEFKDAGTLQLTLDMNGTAGVQVIQLGVDSDDLVFNQYDGSEVMRIADDRAVYFFDKGGEKISSDGTDFTFNSGNDINLTATTDINIPSNVGLTFGNDGEKIEGDGTDLTIAGNNINLTAVADVVIPNNVGIQFGGASEKIEGDGTDLTIAGNNINLTAVADVVIPNNVGIQFGGASEKIEGDGTDLVISANNLTIDAAADITLDAAGNDLNFAAGGTTVLTVSNSSSDVIIKPVVDAKDIIFQQRDGTEVARIEDNATFNVSTAGKFAYAGTAVTATAAELNLLDGGTSVGSSITLADADGFVINDGGVMKTIPASDIKTYNPGGIAWQSVQTSAFTAVAGRGYPCNTTSAGFTVTLPGSASVGDTIALVDYAGTFATNNIRLTSSLNIEGLTKDKLLTTNREGIIITYADATQGWVTTSGVNSGDQALDPVIYSVDFLVIAGGGGGAGYYYAGAGGAGGYRNSYSSETSGGGGSSETSLTFNGGVVYTITVGAGGAGGAGLSVGTKGSDSLLSGSDITDISSAGGGRGKHANTSPDTDADGGSGGGGNAFGPGISVVGGSGTANQGYAGGTSRPIYSNGGTGGGGGAAGTGGNGGSGNNGGNGGNGLASSITGSSVSRGGGGGGSTHTATAGIGGTGGGGNGAKNDTTTQATAGTANTGGGGGSASHLSNTPTGASGGSGVVILRMPTSGYSGTTTGSPTVSTSGTDTILIYNASGSYTG